MGAVCHAASRQLGIERLRACDSVRPADARSGAGVGQSPHRRTCGGRRTMSGNRAIEKRDYARGMLRSLGARRSSRALRHGTQPSGSLRMRVRPETRLGRPTWVYSYSENVLLICWWHLFRRPNGIEGVLRANVHLAVAHSRRRVDARVKIIDRQNFPVAGGAEHDNLAMFAGDVHFAVDADG